MQIHSDSKGKVAMGDVTLWANRYTKCNGNTISRFHLIAHVSGGEFFTWGITFCDTRCISAKFVI